MAQGLLGGLAITRGDARPLSYSCSTAGNHAQRHYEVFASVIGGDLAEALAMSGRLDEALATIDEVVSERKGGRSSTCRKCCASRASSL